MLELDINIVLWLNQHSQMNRIVDGLLVAVNRYHLFRGAVVVALLWCAWMGSRQRLVTHDLFLVKAIFGVFVAIAVARACKTSCRPAAAVA
jgi:hypothetical protein